MQNLKAFTDAGISYQGIGTGAAMIVDEDANIKELHLVNFGEGYKRNGIHELELKMQILALTVAPENSVKTSYSDSDNALAAAYRITYEKSRKFSNRVMRQELLSAFKRQGQSVEFHHKPRDSMGISMCDEFARVAKDLPKGTLSLTVPEGLGFREQLDWLGERCISLKAGFFQDHASETRATEGQLIQETEGMLRRKPERSQPERKNRGGSKGGSRHKPKRHRRSSKLSTEALYEPVLDF